MESIAIRKQKALEFLELHGYIAVIVGDDGWHVTATDPETQERVTFPFSQSRIDSLVTIFVHKILQGVL